MNKTIYLTADREAGNVIDILESKALAEAKIRAYEDADREDGTYSPDFYEVQERTAYETLIDGRRVALVVPENFGALRDNHAQSESGVAWFTDAERVLIDGYDVTDKFDATIYWHEPEAPEDFTGEDADLIDWDNPTEVCLNSRYYLF